MSLNLLQGVFGLGGLVALAWLASENRRAFPTKWTAVALTAQLVLALALLKVPLMWQGLSYLNGAVMALERASRVGSAYMFGYVGGAPLPFEAKGGVSSVILAFEILPIVIVTAAVAALLWHWRVLPAIIRGFSWALQRTMGIGGAAGLGTAANLFFGVVEAPLFIRAYLAGMTRTELFMVMTAGLATVSGVVLVLYATTLAPVLPDATSHIIAASVISLPAALLMARIMVPGDAATGADRVDEEVRYESSLHAITVGTMDGMKLFLAIIAILIVVFALVALANDLLALLPDVAGGPLTLARLFGWAFAPLVWLFGIPADEALAAGNLMGVKAVLNEYVAYQALAALEPGTLSPRSTVIMTYAMCGFANFASIGLMVSTIGTLAPSRRGDVVALGLKAWLAGNLATGMTGTVIGLVT